MTTLTERLIHAYNRNDNIASIIKARLKNKSKLSKIFIIQTTLDNIELLPRLPGDFLAKSTIIHYLTKYLKGILHEH